MCFMAQDNQVSTNFDNEELLEAFNELFLKFKDLNASYKCLKTEKENLQCELTISHSTQLDSLMIYF